MRFVCVSRLPALYFGISLCACSSPGTGPVGVADTAQWLQKACGVVPSAPVIQKAGGQTHSSPQQGRTTWVEGTVVLTQDDASMALATLRKDKGLNLRGASATRYSFQSPDGRTQVRECELDTGTRELYFLYAE
jgi:hypothetical protein